MQPVIMNRVLGQLSPEDFARLSPFLTPVALQARDILVPAGASVDQCYFIESGLISVIMQVDATRVEVGMIGSEGVVCASSAVLDGRCAADEHVVQIAGTAYGIALPELRAALCNSAVLAEGLRRFVQAELVQARHTAFVNASFGIAARLARWLLMCHDRVEGDALVLTHDVLAVMLGVRRSGVTLAVQNLEGTGCIRARRGRITILHRDRLVAAAAGSYATAESNYERPLAEAEAGE